MLTSFAIIPSSLQAASQDPGPVETLAVPGFGGIFYATTQGNIDLDLSGSTGPAGPVDGFAPIPTLEGASIVLMSLMIALMGAGALTVRRH